MFRSILKWVGGYRPPIDAKEVELPKTKPEAPMVWYHDAHVYKHTQDWFQSLETKPVSGEVMTAAVEWAIDYYDTPMARLS